MVRITLLRRTQAQICVGGFPRWQAEGLPVEESEPAAIEPTSYATPKPVASGSVRSYEHMTAADPSKEVIL